MIFLKLRLFRFRWRFIILYIYLERLHLLIASIHNIFWFHDFFRRLRHLVELIQIICSLFILHRWLFRWRWLVKKCISLETDNWALGGETWTLWWCLEVLDWWWTWLFWVPSSMYLPPVNCERFYLYLSDCTISMRYCLGNLQMFCSCS